MGTKLLNHLGIMYIQRSDVYEVNIEYVWNQAYCSHGKLVPKVLPKLRSSCNHSSFLQSTDDASKVTFGR